MADDQVRFDIKVDVLNAIQQLKKIADSSDSSSEAVKRLNMFLLKMSKDTRIPLEQLRKSLQDINNQLIRSGKGGAFSSLPLGNAGIFKAEKAYSDAAQAAGRFQVSQGGVVSSINRGNRAWDEADRAARGYGHGIDVVRTALGTLLAVGVFQFLNALSAGFTQLLHNIRETELAVYNLINAEKRLSEQGIDITPKGLQEIIDSVRELVPILSQIQAEELVSRIATNVAPALKLTNEQIKQMAEATALLYIRNKALGKSFDEVESQLTNAFLTGKVSQGINNLGVKINDQIVRDEALRMGLVKTQKEFDNLTGEMESQVKAAAMLSVVYQNATQDVEAIGEYMETSDAQIERAKTAWSDFLTVAGTAFGPLIAQGMEMIAHALEIAIKLLEAGKPLIEYWVVRMVALAETMRNLPQYLKIGGGALFAENFQQNLIETEELFRSLAEAVDTPTAAIEDLGSAIDNLDIEGLKAKIEDIIEDTQRAREDLAENMQRKLEDLDEEYRRKALDAETDYLRKIEDINRDAERDMARVRQRHREQDQRDEEKYQLALWELRMRFLMDLEDALHARDARQVIRLQKQYNLDKEALRRKHELEGREREQNQRNELEDIERRRQERLADARLEYDQKLADQRLAKQRELDDLNTWYAREQADIELAQQRKLETLLKGWIEEQKITEENAGKVYEILKKYFGPGGMTDELYAYMMNSLASVTGQAAAVAAQMAQLGSIGTHNPATGDTTTSSSSGSAGGGNGGGGNTSSTSGRSRRGRAEGGTLIATRPTSVIFGEAGAEMATFTPLNRIGRDENKVGFNGNLSNLGMDGQIALEVSLSPDLEARVIEKSMNGVADVIVKVTESK